MATAVKSVGTKASGNPVDERLTQVEQSKDATLSQVNTTYNNLIKDADKFYNKQADAVEEYGKTQADIQQQQTDQSIKEINQNKEWAEKDYKKEQTGAYVDYQKQTNDYGANAERMAAQGLSGTGYSESSKVSMYNAYQNRVATARESYAKAVQEYDNQIAQARLANNAKLAEIAFNTLQTKLSIAIEGLQYKNGLIKEQLNTQMAVDNTYWGRQQDVIGQLNVEAARAMQQKQQAEEMQYKYKASGLDEQTVSEKKAIETSNAKKETEIQAQVKKGNTVYTWKDKDGKLHWSTYRYKAQAAQASGYSVLQTGKDGTTAFGQVASGGSSGGGRRSGGGSYGGSSGGSSGGAIIKDNKDNNDGKTLDEKVDKTPKSDENNKSNTKFNNLSTQARQLINQLQVKYPLKDSGIYGDTNNNRANLNRKSEITSFIAKNVTPAQIKGELSSTEVKEILKILGVGQ